MDLSAAPNPDDFQYAGQSDLDKGLLVKFFLKPREFKIESEKEGRPVFRDQEYISIMVPGTRNGVARRATDNDKARFPLHYEAFKKRMDAPDAPGTPLAEWPPMSRSMVEQLAFFNVKTVEQLSAVPDSKTPNIMGLTKFRELAKAFLKAAEADAPLVQMQAELAERDSKIEVQQNTIDALTARLDALEAAQRPETYQETLPVPPRSETAPETAQEAEEPLPTYQSVLDAAVTEVVPPSEPDRGVDPEALQPEKAKTPAKRRRTRR